MRRKDDVVDDEAAMGVATADDGEKPFEDFFAVDDCPATAAASLMSRNERLLCAIC